MNYFNFKRNKFSTIAKRINAIGYNLIKIFKIKDIRKYYLNFFFKIPHYQKYIFSKLYKKISLIKKFDLDFFLKILNYQKYIFFKLYQRVNPKIKKNLVPNFVGILFFISFLYLIIPSFYSYDKVKAEKLLCKNNNLECSISGKIKYNFLPTPRITVKDLKLNNSSEDKDNFFLVKRTVLKLNLKNLLNKNKQKIKKIEFNNFKINLNIDKIKLYNEILKLNNSIPADFLNGEILFFENKNYITKINNVELNFKSSKKDDEFILSGKFLNDTLNVKFIKNKTNQDNSKLLTLRLLNSGIFTKINILNQPENKNILSGDILFKKNKNILTTLFDFDKKKIIFKNANLRNSFLEGKFSGIVELLPYFNFNLDVDLKGLNLTKFYSFFTNLETKAIFKINRKINGQLNLSANKTYSKFNLIKSFESQLEFNNGDILVNRLLLSMGKIGAADLNGIIDNSKKIQNFKFETNIFIDNVRRFYSKFGVRNREKLFSSLFFRGNFNLEKLNLTFQEMGNENQFNENDISYIENEFNAILLEDGYKSLFSFPNLKEFIKLVVAEEN